MAFLDSTAVNVALPSLARDFNAGFAWFQWVLNAYLVALSALVLPGGALADRLGRRRIFITGAAGFAAASALCAWAPDIGTLVVARGLQGIAAALLIPSSLAMVQAGFDEADRGRAIGLWSGLSGLSTLVGPLLGGWLVDTVSWRAVFVLNLPLAALAILLALFAIERDRATSRRTPLDTPGAVMAAGMLGALVFALTQGPEWGWSHPAVLAALALGALATLGFVDAERNHSAPMLPLHHFGSRDFIGANGVTLCVYFALSGLFFLLTIQLQRVLGYSALSAGAAVAPVTVLLLLLSPAAGRRAAARGPRGLLIVGPLMAAAGALLLSRVRPGVAYAPDILPGILVFGLGLALTVAPVTAAALDALDPSRAGVAAGVNNAVARTGQLLAVPILPLLAGLTGPGQVGGLDFSHGFQLACRLAALVLVLAALTAWAALPRLAKARAPT